jgi:hypothetical protein
MRTARLLGTALIILAAVGPSAGADDEERMRYAQLRHEQTVSLYSRVYAKFRTEARKNNGDVHTNVVEWWEDGGRVRAKTGTTTPHPEKPNRLFETASDCAIRDGVQTFLLKSKTSAGRPHNGVVIDKKSRDEYIGPDLWECSGLAATSAPTRLFKDFWKLDTWRHRPAPPLPGSNAVGVESQWKEGSGKTVIVYLDPAHDYLPSKLIIYWYNGRLDTAKQHVVYDVLEYHPKGPDLPTAFPKRVRATFYGRNGVLEAPLTEGFYTIETVKVPKAIPEETFTLKIPAGYQVADKIKGVVYLTGPDGGPAPGTKVTPIRRDEAPKKSPSKEEPPEAYSVGIPPSEPRNWVLYSGVTLVVVGIAC